MHPVRFGITLKNTLYFRDAQTGELKSRRLSGLFLDKPKEVEFHPDPNHPSPFAISYHSLLDGAVSVSFPEKRDGSIWWEEKQAPLDLKHFQALLVLRNLLKHMVLKALPDSPPYKQVYQLLETLRQDPKFAIPSVEEGTKQAYPHIMQNLSVFRSKVGNGSNPFQRSLQETILEYPNIELATDFDFWRLNSNKANNRLNFSIAESMQLLQNAVEERTQTCRLAPETLEELSSLYQAKHQQQQPQAKKTDNDILAGVGKLLHSNK